MLGDEEGGGGGNSSNQVVDVGGAWVISEGMGNELLATLEVPRHLELLGHAHPLLDEAPCDDERIHRLAVVGDTGERAGDLTRTWEMERGLVM